MFIICDYYLFSLIISQFINFVCLMFLAVTIRAVHWSYLRGSCDSVVEHRTGDRGVLVLNPAGGTSLRNFGNSVYPALPVSFGGYTKSRRSLLSGV